jgi:hypothetical protein
MKPKKKNKYQPLERTVQYSRKKNLQPIPEVGKKYHCFDDGKITFSRHYMVQVDEVLGYIQFKKKYPEEFQYYCQQSKRCYWLYSRSTDKFIITHKGENNEFGVFVRTKQGGWFGIGDWYNCGRLDVTGNLWNNLIANIDKFDYTEEEKKNILKEYE